jgi:hypothetical protein
MLRSLSAGLALACAFCAQAKESHPPMRLDIHFKCSNEDLVIGNANKDYLSASYKCDANGYVVIAHKD